MAKRALSLTSLQDVQKFVAELGCGSETHGPNCWRVTTPNEGTAKRVVDALKKAGVYIYPPRTDPPDNAKPEEGRKEMKPAIEGYPVGQEMRPPIHPGGEPAIIYTIDIGWEYVKVAGAEQPVAQIAREKPKPMKVTSE